MFVNFETTSAAIRAEQQVAHLRATKLGPLLAEAERKSAAAVADASPASITLIGLLVRQLRSVLPRWLRHSPDVAPSAGK